MDDADLAYAVIVGIIIVVSGLWKVFSRKAADEAKTDATEWEKTLKTLLQGSPAKPAPPPTPAPTPTPRPHQTPLQPTRETNRIRVESLASSEEDVPAAQAAYPVEHEHSAPSLRPDLRHPPARLLEDARVAQAAHYTGRAHPPVPAVRPAALTPPPEGHAAAHAAKEEKVAVGTPFAGLHKLSPLQAAFMHSEIFAPRRRRPRGFLRSPRKPPEKASGQKPS